MHVGYTPLFQNLGKPIPDHEVYRLEMAMAEQAEGMGFDSVWSIEHHFTDYTMVPDPACFCTPALRDAAVFRRCCAGRSHPVADRFLRFRHVTLPPRRNCTGRSARGERVRLVERRCRRE